MRRCRSCGGVLGVDCFNEEECMWISDQQERQKEQQIEYEAYAQSERIAQLEQKIAVLENKIAVLDEEKYDLISRVKEVEIEIRSLQKRLDRI